MAAYSEYKESGQQWLGKIPSHWKFHRLWTLFNNRIKSNSDFAYQHAHKFYYGTLVPKNEINDVEDLRETYVKYSVLEKDDIVLNGLNLNYDLKSMRVAIAPQNGIITSAYIILRPEKDVNAKFFNYYFKAMDSKKIFHGMGTGIRLTLSYAELRNIDLACPPAEEQEAIVAYLDKATAEIDKAIEAKERIISALEERRKIIITEAVTRGINPDVPLRDSGIDWLGQIPSHWEVLPLKRVSTLILGKMFDNSGGESSSQIYPYVCAKDVHFDGVDLSELKEMYFSDTEIKRYCVQNGDLLVVEGGAGAGGCAVAKKVKGNIGIQNSIIIVRANGNSDNEYLSYFLQSLVRRGYIEYSCNKATIPHFTKDKIGVVPIEIPPIQEQKEIVAYIKAMEIPIDNSIAQQKRLIELLRERKNIIINETVTGKVKVI